MVLLLILVSTTLISFIALVGGVTLIWREEFLHRFLLILVSFAAGTLMGGAFLHLIPEALEKQTHLTVLCYLLLGFILMFFLERIIYWRHCHRQDCDIHTFSYMNLVGDSIHNFIDGLIIAASFITSLHLGMVTTLAIAIHEIPQEVGDFGVLVYGGFSRFKALALNFLIALAVTGGGLVCFFFFPYARGLIDLLLPLAAGGFIYIASSDLIPEIRQEENLVRSMFTFLVFIAGVLLMAGVRRLF